MRLQWPGRPSCSLRSLHFRCPCARGLALHRSRVSSMLARPRAAPDATTPTSTSTSSKEEESSSSGEGAGGPTSPSTPMPQPGAEPGPTRIKRTMADLDALLGIREEDPGKGQASPMQANAAGGTSPASPPLSRSGAGSDQLDKAVASEAQRLGRTLGGEQRDGSRNGAAPGGGPGSPDMEDHIQKIIDKARRLAEEQGTEGKKASTDTEQAALKREFESFLDTLTKAPEALSKEDIQRLKDAAFGPLTFWVIETRTIQEANRVGLLVRGNLRDDRDKVFDIVCEKVKELFGGRYEVLMVEDTEGGSDATGPSPLAGMSGMPMPSSSVGKARGMREGPRVAFQIIAAEQARPAPPDTIQNVASLILSLLLLVTCTELALSLNITKLPPETLAYLANPDSFNKDAIPPGLENWDPTTYLQSALPLAAALLGVNFAHEAGHRVAALAKGVQLGPSFFIPFGQVGSLGAITPFASLLKNRQVLWDVAGAGPLVGGLVSLALLLFGLSQSAGADPSDPATTATLISLPTQFFQGSVALGGLSRLLLGGQALRGATVLVSPLAIAGWCGLFTTALNLLPVGCLDGGRMVQATYGKQALAVTSFFTYVGLGLGILGSSLSLPFGLYVILCQRAAEKYIQDNVSPAGPARMTATATSVLAAILILLPMAPELAQSLGVGPAGPFL